MGMQVAVKDRLLSQLIESRGGCIRSSVFRGEYCIKSSVFRYEYCIKSSVFRVVYLE